MAINRNILFLLLGALLVGVGVLGYELYREKKDPMASTSDWGH
jgi:hypothetical protein